MQRKAFDTELLYPYLAASYLFLLLNASVFYKSNRVCRTISVIVFGNGLCELHFLYLLPVVLVLAVLKAILSRPLISGFFHKANINPQWILYIPAVLLTWLLQVLIFADGFIFRFYSFHINGFVWNLVFTQGGIESMGGDTATFLTFSAIVCAFSYVQSLLLVVLLFLNPIRKFCLHCLQSPTPGPFRHIAAGFDGPAECHLRRE